MADIVFFDLEINPSSGKIQDIGASRGSHEFHNPSEQKFIAFLKETKYIAGHNIIRHDLKYIGDAVRTANPNSLVIDTLDLAPLLFPSRPYHKLVKDDKLLSDELNNPLSDSIKAKDLFYDEVSEFQNLDPDFKSILFGLLQHEETFSAFFDFLDFKEQPISVKNAISHLFQHSICANADVSRLIDQSPAALAYCLALIRAKDQYSILPRWLHYTRPGISQIMRTLRSHRCLEGCEYCDLQNNAHAGLKSFFKYEAFRTFGGESLQENAVKAALQYESLLTVFPTGGGKSITFQLPALMQGQQNKGLTVVISPLQSLMKDQVDNLEQAGIVSSATINGLLDPIDRAKSFERVADGQVNILYLSPESLRSPSIEKLILNRNINRFVIDEAHCFSSWGHDFRVDYLYIGEFIKNIQDKRMQDMAIPVSCFTATAKPQVINDIAAYFRKELGIELKIFQTKEPRKNLKYKVYEQGEASEKYNTLRDLLTQRKTPSIVYVSRTRNAEELANKLTADGLPALVYHGKLKSNVKIEHQEAFLKKEANIMVATSAFGMGVDKKDIQTVIHYDISESLENYVQEAGRAGRDEKIEAECFILFDEEDLNKHFILQNSTRLDQIEINQVWRAIKGLTKFRSTISQSALEIARQAGWDDSVREIETRVTTAIAALEEAGYVKRKNNQARVYADSLQYKTAQAAIDRINECELFSEAEKINAIRIVKKLISSKRKAEAQDDEGETRVEYLADSLGIPLKDVIHVITLMRQEKLLADAKDLTAYVDHSNPESKLLFLIKSFQAILSYALEFFEEGNIILRLKECREEINERHGVDVTVRQIRSALIFLGIQNWIKLMYVDPEKNIAHIHFVLEIEDLRKRIEDMLVLAPFIGQLLIQKAKANQNPMDQVLVEFSIGEIHEALNQSGDLQIQQVSKSVVEDAIFYLTKIEALSIEGGFLVIYKGLRVERIEEDTRKQYKIEDYKELEQYYQSKIQQVHIVGEYARKMIHDYEGALKFVDDYFGLSYDQFLNRYFPESRRDEIKRTITPEKFRQLFGTVSPPQLEIIKDKSLKTVVLAGPGSGKTLVLVHKLAAIFLMENIKREQVLMLTFSRAAVTEFKQRLHKLIGNAARFIEIKTFHSYCFDLLGRVGDLTSADHIIKDTVNAIRDESIDKIRITKLIMLIDEAQDINQEEFQLLQLLMERNDGMRVIMVGDDDQNIFEFRGSSAEYLEDFIRKQEAKEFELVQNYRSGRHLVDFTNAFAATIKNRLKKHAIESVVDRTGIVKIIRYTSRQLTVPVVNEIIQHPMSGDACILTRTNLEASQVHRMLKQKGYKTQLVQTNEGFRLSHLKEISALLTWLSRDKNNPKISGTRWEALKRHAKSELHSSHWYPMIERMMTEFDLTNPKEKYLSDLESFLQESKMEDFLFIEQDTIFVSTYHKAKGREFENVHVVIRESMWKEEDKRTLYVAMTRAKSNLVLHVNGNQFERQALGDFITVQDTTLYNPPEEVTLQLSHEHVRLSDFSSWQATIESLTSGDPLLVNIDGCTTLEGKFVLRFASKYYEEQKKLAADGYRPKSSSVNYLVYWDAADGKEVLIVLPEIIFRKEKSKI